MINGSNIRLPNGQFSTLVTPVNKDGVTQFVTPVDFNGNIISGGGGSPGGSDTQVQFNDAGAFGGDSGLTYNKTTDTLTAGSVTSTIFTALPANNASAFTASGSSLTGSNAQSLVNLSQTWNTTGTPTAIFADITDTASNAASLLMDLRVGGTSRFSVTKAGVTNTSNVTFATGTNIAASSGGLGVAIQITANNTATFLVSSGRVIMSSSALFGWVSGVALQNVADVTLARDGASILAQRTGTASQTYRLYKSFTDASNYTRAAWQFDANGVVLAGESAGTGDANIGFSFGIKGIGAFQLQQTDNTATGGNARGANAVDLQTVRTLATRVASGLQSFVAGGNNTASGNGAAALGSVNTASGNFSFAVGNLCTASGVASIALGENASTKQIGGLFALASSSIVNALGKTQMTVVNIGVSTTNDTPAVLRSTYGAAGTTNQLVLQNNSALYVEGLVIANVTGAGDTSSWKITATIKRGANAASTALVGTPTVTVAHQNAGASGWVVAVTADTTNGCLAVTVTGQAATTIRWTCTLFASEVAF